MNILETSQISAFIAVVEHQSFTKAAEVLDLTQPSLSARIISLEKEMNEKLFQRTGRGVRLTDAGKALVPYAERILQFIVDGKEAVWGVHSNSAGKIRIGSARAICAYVLPSIVEKFRTLYPGVDVTIKTGRSSDIVDMVLEDDVEIGLTRSIYHPDLQVRHLYDEQIVLVTAPSHKFAIHGKASIYDVASQPLILYDKGSSYFVLINRVVREAGIAPNVTMDLDSIEATKKMIERGLGLSFLPRHSVEQELKLGTLTEIDIIEDYSVELPTSVIVRNSINRSLVVESFLDLLYSLYPKRLDN